MRTLQRVLPIANRDSSVVTTLAAIIALVVFGIDALTPLDIAVAVFYVVVVLLVASTNNRPATLAAAWGCVALTLLGFVMSHDSGYTSGAIARCLASLVAIGTTSLLSLRNQAATTKLQEQVELLNLAHDAIVVHDMNDRITFWNYGAQALYGWTAQQALGRSIHALTQTSSSVPIEQIREQLLRTSRWHGELQRVRHDGSVVVISSRSALWRDAAGTPRAVLATNNDITKRKEMEARLQRQQEELRATIDAIPGMVWSSLSDGRLTFINRRWNDMGVTLDEGESGADVWSAIVHPADLPQMQRDWQAAIAAGGSFENVSRIRTSPGGYRWMHLGAEPLRDAAGTILRWYGVNTDIEERKQAQEALARSSAELAHVTRVTLLGELAASIAHEVTQPIAAVAVCGGAALRWLNRPTPELGEVEESVKQMIRDARRASEIIQRIRAMAKKRDRNPTSMDLNGIVCESVELMRREFEHHRVELQFDLDEPSTTVCCDRVQLQQVLVNLLMNSVQAMADVDGARKLRIATRRVDPEHAQVMVQDSGTGVSEENADRLFSTFFTTKADGMGMGLSICRSIVEAHGGRIWAESPEAGGAMLQFILPVDEGRYHEQ